MITAGEVFAAIRRKRESRTKDWHHNVYVIELDKSVLKDRRFRAANPGHDPAKACLYVGCTGMSPEMRFVNHRRGYKSNRYAEKYGLRLRPDFFTCYNPMPYAAALDMEQELAAALREEGHAVWQY